MLGWGGVCPYGLVVDERPPRMTVVSGVEGVEGVSGQVETGEK